MKKYKYPKNTKLNIPFYRNKYKRRAYNQMIKQNNNIINYYKEKQQKKNFNEQTYEDTKYNKIKFIKNEFQNSSIKIVNKREYSLDKLMKKIYLLNIDDIMIENKNIKKIILKLLL